MHLVKGKYNLFIIYHSLFDSIYIFLLQGAFMNNRMEDENETNALVERILNFLETSTAVSSRPQLPSLAEATFQLTSSPPFTQTQPQSSSPLPALSHTQTQIEPHTTFPLSSPPLVQTQQEASSTPLTSPHTQTQPQSSPSHVHSPSLSETQPELSPTSQMQSELPSNSPTSFLQSQHESPPISPPTHAQLQSPSILSPSPLSSPLTQTHPTLPPHPQIQSDPISAPLPLHLPQALSTSPSSSLLTLSPSEHPPTSPSLH